MPKQRKRKAEQQRVERALARWGYSAPLKGVPPHRAQQILEERRKAEAEKEARRTVQRDIIPVLRRLSSISTRRLLKLLHQARLLENGGYDVYAAVGLRTSYNEIKQELDHREHVATTKEEKKAERRARTRGRMPFDSRKKFCTWCETRIKSRPARKRLFYNGLEFCHERCRDTYQSARFMEMLADV